MLPSGSGSVASRNKPSRLGDFSQRLGIAGEHADEHAGQRQRDLHRREESRDILRQDGGIGSNDQVIVIRSVLQEGDHRIAVAIIVKPGLEGAAAAQRVF